MITRGTKHFKERDNFCVGQTSVSGFPCFYHQLNVSLPQSSGLKFLIVKVCWWPPNAGIQPACTWPWIFIPSLISPKLHLPSSHFQLPSRHGCLDIKPSTSMCSKLDSLLFIFLSVKWIILSFKYPPKLKYSTHPWFFPLTLSFPDVTRNSYFYLHNCLSSGLCFLQSQSSSSLH